MLNHVKNSEAGRKNWEPHVDSLFKVTFLPPQKVIDYELLTEQVVSATGWKAPGPEAVQQQFQQARRNYASTEVDNTQNITMSFELNLNDEFQNFVYNTIMDWRSIVYNPLTGQRGLKKDYAGTIIVESYAADGTIYWVRKLKNAFPTGDLDSIGQNDYSSTDPVKLEQVFTADYYEEERL